MTPIARNCSRDCQRRAGSGCLSAEPKRLLIIAGSDSSGGAGIQADLRALAACCTFGATAITAITAQNTVGVEAVVAIPPDAIVAQVRAVAEDIGVDAVKIGMLGDEPTIRAVLNRVHVTYSGADGGSIEGFFPGPTYSYAPGPGASTGEYDRRGESMTKHG